MTDRDIWIAAYLAALASGKGPQDAWSQAEMALQDCKERWPDENS